MKNKKIKKSESGFTLIEILVVIGLIALLAGVVIIAINPARQFAQGRNSQRVSNVNAILNAIGQNIADNKGIFTCDTATYPGAIIDGTIRVIKLNTAATVGESNLRPCIVPTYISEIPVDPGAQDATTYPAGTNTCTDNTCSAGDYNTEYTVLQDANGRVTVCAPNAQHETALGAGLQPICVTR